MRGYKVLTHKRRSCVVVLREGGRHYPVGEAVRAKRGYGPLCVFANKRAAVRFANTCLLCEGFIVKCKYEPSHLYNIWQGRDQNWGRSLAYLPAGTALATTVTCLE